MKRLSLIISVIACFILCSCKTHEGRVLDRINNLTEKVEKNYNKWDVQQWQDALDELEDINHDMQDCEFSTDQKKEVEKAQGRLTAIIMTKGVEVLGEELTEFINGPGAFMDGFQQ